MLICHPRLCRAMPRLWLMSDTRMGADFLPAVRRLPKGSGLVFRHYGLSRQEREALLAHVQRIAKARRLVLIDRLANHSHPHLKPHLPRTANVHNRRELVAARRRGATAIFISPLYPTRTHPDARILGRLGFIRLAVEARKYGLVPIALGGMNAARFARLTPYAYGWAGIDAFIATNWD
jgi:thiamine-phosphate pyrophosphorylase